MVSILNFSGGIKRQRPLSHKNRRAIPLRSKVQEATRTCESTLLTANGINCGNTTKEANKLWTSKTTNALMLKEAKMKKAKMLLHGRDTTAQTRDGRLSTLTIKRRIKIRVLTRTSDSMWTDLSISNLDCQWGESSKQLEQITSSSRLIDQRY